MAVKIGVTKWSRVAERLAALQSSNHESLELLGVIPFRGVDQPMKAAEDREQALHREFCELQRAPKGHRGYEWFTASSGLLDFIKSESIPPEPFDFRRRARPSRKETHSHES